MQPALFPKLLPFLRSIVTYLWRNSTIQVLLDCIYNLTKTYGRCSWHSCTKCYFWRAFNDGLVDNDEKVASSKEHTQCKASVKNHTLFETIMTKSTAYWWLKGLKNHTLWGCTPAHIRVFPHPPPPHPTLWYEMCINSCPFCFLCVLIIRHVHKRKLGKCYATFVLVSLIALCDGGVLLSCRKYSLMYQSRSMITGWAIALPLLAPHLSQ